jgi:sarcosine oxidase, subunit alpha
MTDFRIEQHPVLPVPDAPRRSFFWQGQQMSARSGETIAAALFANGVRIFGHHPKDKAPLGIFCANGQCAQCSVIADGLPVKSCMVQVAEGMRVAPLDGRPSLPESTSAAAMREIETLETECLILGGGPAGLAAAIELGRAGVNVIVVDDKHVLGGKLVLQTHKFFGSIEACQAGTRGLDIGKSLEAEVRSLASIKVWTETTALAIFSDRKVGVLRQGRYVLIAPQILLVATGARERSLVFKGNTLPGVYGAGAFQTLVNRDLVRPTRRLFVIGGGNVGLIAAYHALQAGIEVVGLCEALPDCGGYKVHKDKLVRMGVPIYPSHSVVSANGREEVESITIAGLDAGWKTIPGTERTFACDTVLVAVGLEPVDEFLKKGREYGLPVLAAGDAEEIAEASAAMFTGRIRGLQIAKKLGRDVGEVPPEWARIAEVLKSRPGAVITEEIPDTDEGIYPVFHCSQEIPCNPCTSVCQKGAIRIEGDDMLGVPSFDGECSGCEKCVAICPGLAITLVDWRKQNDGSALVTVPFEFSAGRVKEGERVVVLDTAGAVLGEAKVERVRAPKYADRALLVKVRADKSIAKRIAGIRVQDPVVTAPMSDAIQRIPDDQIVCRCERVTAGELRRLIRAGDRDMNELKAATRCGMGACGGKTCPSLVKRLFREEGVAPQAVTELTGRPLFIEVPLGAFAGIVAEGSAEQSEAAPHKPASVLTGGL